jgi:TetR/AcrR family transcriptional regulator
MNEPSAPTTKATVTHRQAKPVAGADSARDRLLESATQEFAEKGFAGARVNDIAAAASINKQLVYHYFGSKDNLYSAVLERALRNSRASDGELALSLDDPVDALRQFIDHITHTSTAGFRLQRLLMDANWHEGRHLDGIEDMSEDLSQRYRLLERILVAGVKLGAFRSGIDARDLYISILGVISVRVTNAYTLSRTLRADLLSAEGRAKSRLHAIDMVVHAVLRKGDASDLDDGTPGTVLETPV